MSISSSMFIFWLLNLFIIFSICHLKIPLCVFFCSGNWYMYGLFLSAFFFLVSLIFTFQPLIHLSLCWYMKWDQNIDSFFPNWLLIALLPFIKLHFMFLSVSTFTNGEYKAYRWSQGSNLSSSTCQDQHLGQIAYSLCLNCVISKMSTKSLYHKEMIHNIPKDLGK